MRPRFLTDENIAQALVLGLQRRVADIDIVRVQDVGLMRLSDPQILSWAAGQGRVLISRDVKTIPMFAHDRITAGLGMPGVFVMQAATPLATAIDDLELIAVASNADEWINRVVYLPLR